MYLVDFRTFRNFVSKKNLWHPLPPFTTLPVILEYKSGDKLIAKIEVISLKELKFLSMNKDVNPDINKLKNKYWIRGEEWPMVNGMQVKKLIV